MPDEFAYELKIPKERIAVLIGKDGEVKKHLESEASVSIEVNSEEGDVILKGTDPIALYSMQEVIKAIGRGFNPEIAMILMKADYCLDIVSLSEYSKTKNDMIRLKGRVIGADGKARKTIEELTEAHICVYGKTIAIIGEVSRVSVARRAVEALLAGSPHANVYHWLEGQRRNMKRAEMVGE